MFRGVINGWNSHEFDILQSILREYNPDSIVDLGLA